MFFHAAGQTFQLRIGVNVLPLFLQRNLLLGRESVKQRAALFVRSEQFVKRCIGFQVVHLRAQCVPEDGFSFGKVVKQMPLVNYCRKCKAEVPLGESCCYCGGKLTQTGEQISFGVVRAPVKEWFAWNNLLRVALPVLALVFVTVLIAEGAAAGQDGLIALFKQGFLGTMLGVLAATVGGVWVLLYLQGVENVHVVLDRQGVHIRTYLPEGSEVGLYARFLSPVAAEKLAQEDERPPLEGLMLVRRVTLPWSAINRVRIWREGSAILFFHPTFWQAAAVRCPIGELPEAEAYVRKKLKRQKKTKILPYVKEEKSKKAKDVT